MELRTQILVNGTYIDLFEDIPMSLNYSIADIREPDKRNTSFSKTINIPGSKSNNILFGHIFKIDLSINSTGTTNFSPSFNPNLKADCIVYIDKVEVFKGIMQLLRITMTDKYEWNYEINLFGNLGNIFSKIGNGELTDLDLSEFDHVYNATSIRNSWTLPVGNGYAYPMVDYGLNELDKWNVIDFKPAIYLKTLIDKIFEFAGFTYTSDFFSSDLFKRLIIPFNSGNLILSDSQILLRQFTALKNTYEESPVSLSISTPIEINEVSDPGGVYDSSWRFVAPANGVYKFFATINAQINSVPNSTFFTPITSTNPIGSSIAFVKMDLGGALHVVSNTLFGYGLLPTTDPQPKSGALIASVDNLGNARQATAETGEVSLISGEKIYMVAMSNHVYPGAIFQNSIGGNIGGTNYMRILPGSTFSNKVVNNGIREGETVFMNNVIPLKIKMRDILKSVFNAFNLYIEDNKDVSSNLIINTRNDFYTGGVTIDWTKKWDISKEQVIEPMGALDAKKYIFTYDSDDDYYNKKYKDQYQRIYGDRQINIINDFLKDDKETKLIFASTPIIGQESCDRVIPTIISVDQTGNKIKKTGKIRMLYWAGLKNCQPNWSFIATSGTTSENKYPYAGHLDDPYISTLDINFGVPQEIYFSSGTIFFTNNNLYNKYYKKFLEEITDKDSKIVTIWFNLNVADINKLDFRNLIFVDGIYYRINKVIDYNPTSDGLTKVELLKIKEGIPFIATSGTVIGGYTPLAFDEFNPLINSYESFGNNTKKPTNDSIIILGKNNNVA